MNAGTQKGGVRIGVALAVFLGGAEAGGVELVHEGQLDDILAASDLTLDAEVLRKIDVVSKEILYPLG